MKPLNGVWSDAWTTLSKSLQTLQESIEHSASQVKCHYGYYHHQSKPLVVYASFYKARGGEIDPRDESIDIVVNCLQHL